MTATRAEEVRKLIADPASWIATGLGSGLAPFAPGTAGSALALLPYLGLRVLPLWLQFVVIAVVFVAGTYSADRVCRLLQREDPGAIVIDEWIGQWLTLVLVERTLSACGADLGIGTTMPLPWLLALGFVAFRLCDVLKPWPASWADRQLSGGFGTMVDDALAALWAAPLTLAAWWLLAT